MAGVSKKVNTYDDKWSKVSVALPTLPEEKLPRPVWTCSTDCAPSCGEQGNPVHVMRASGMAGLFFSMTDVSYARRTSRRGGGAPSARLNSLQHTNRALQAGCMRSVPCRHEHVSGPAR